MRIVLGQTDAYLLSPDAPKYEERRQHSLREAAKLGIRAKWFRAIPDMNPRVSASKSIIEICKRSLLHDIPLLFLEDDISVWNEQCAFDLPDDTDVFRLGNSTYFLTRDGNETQRPQHGSMQQISDDLYRVNGMCATHAIVFVTRRAKQAFLDSCQAVLENKFKIYDMQLAIDTYDKLVCYGTVWPVFYQNELYAPSTVEATKVSLVDGQLQYNIIPTNLLFRYPFRHASCQ